MPGKGKRGSARVRILFRQDAHVFFVYGFAKNERDTIGSRVLAALRRLADELLDYDEQALMKALEAKELVEVKHHEE